MEELRCQGYPDFRSIQFAILETNGQLSVLPRASQKPPSCAQLGLSPEEPGLPVVLISDGRLLSQNLKRQGYERRWLDKALSGFGLHSPQQVFLLTVDQSGQLYCVPKEGRG